MKKSPNIWRFTLVNTKNRGYGAPHAAIYHRFEETSLCPITSLKAYLEATKYKDRDDKIFLSYIRPYNSVTSSTIARWLKTTLGEAGITGYTGHSTRSAATSKAAASGLSAKTILAAANWSPRSSTFQRFYCKDIEESFQETVLG